MVDFLPDPLQNGRDAKGRLAARFEYHWAVLVDDGWWRDEEDLPPLATTLEPDAACDVITRNTSPDVNFDVSVNPYRGCEYG